MIMSICAINDPKNNFKPDINLAPVFTGIAVFVYGITFALNTGYAINPARDFGLELKKCCSKYLNFTKMEMFQNFQNFVI